MEEWQQLALSALKYEPKTGIVTWKNACGTRKKGSVAGSQVGGYVMIRYRGKSFYAHQFAVLQMTGSWPAHFVDHIDRDRSNNKWSNLRPATAKQNAINRAPIEEWNSEFRGVKKLSNGMFEASVTLDDNKKIIGKFNDEEEAKKAVIKARKMFLSLF